MTIAACYLSADGVVFGADSTTTMYVRGYDPADPGSDHQYNYAQKIFEVGEESTIGMTMWGLGSLASVGYRTLIARYGDTLRRGYLTTMVEVAKHWGAIFWDSYAAEFAPAIQRARGLELQALRTPAEDLELQQLVQNLSGGFCVGGYLPQNRTPSAWEISYSPLQNDAGNPIPLGVGQTRFWGCPNLINRLLSGIDFGLLEAILRSGKWKGTSDELIDLLAPFSLGQPRDLPIREAVDWVHASIYATIKTLKFSHMAPVCGGPIEVAVITTDRNFRWVRHKGLDAAIRGGE